MKKQLTGIAFLGIAVLIWGSTFVAQSVGMDKVGPFTFQASRCGLAVLFLAPIIALFEIRDIKDYFRKWRNKKLWISGALCGIALFAASTLQQISLVDTDAGKAGFLTALYVIMIPLIGIFIRKKSNWKIWSASLVSVIGSFLLCSDGTINDFGNRGDALMLLCALFFAFQFIAIAKFAPQADALQLAAVQFFTVTVISGIAALVAGESCSWDAIITTAKPLLYCGVIAIGVACTVQIAAQKYVHPATASIILSTASVFAVIWGCLLLDEHYSWQNLIGCGLIFAAVLLVQFPAGKND
jgi:drug/metabolite transporter (DMT)-like permease